MIKFFKLCLCEYTKIMKKASTKVMIVLLILTLFLAAGITQLIKVMDSTFYYQDGNESQNQIDFEIDALKSRLNDSNLDTSTKNEIQAELEMYELAKQYNINIFSYTDEKYWKNSILYDIMDAKIDEYNLKSLQSEPKYNEAKNNTNKLIEIFKNDDYNSYIELQKNNLKKQLDDKTISQEDYDIKLKSLELQEKYDIGKTNTKEDVWKSELVTEIESLQQNINSGINKDTGKVLKEEDLNKAKEKIKINEYRLEHNLKPVFSQYSSDTGSSRKTYDYLVSSFSVAILTILTIIIAGTSISTEISKGTIKFWAFTPNKRWKILLSKLCVITFMLLFTTVAITLLSDLVGNLFFGSTDTAPYLYVQNNEVQEINYILYTLLLNLAKSLEVFIYLLFAMMLSVVTRNTAVAVGISIATDLGSSMFMPILNTFIKKDWIKIIPFNNFNLAQRIFVNDTSYIAMNMQSQMSNNVSLKFSLILLTVCAVLMIITMFDSFKKRDIL